MKAIGAYDDVEKAKESRKVCTFHPIQNFTINLLFVRLLPCERGVMPRRD